MFSKYARTFGATSRPNNSIAFKISSCCIDPNGKCNIKRSNPNISIILINFLATVSGLPTSIAPSGLTLDKYCSNVNGCQNGRSFEIASTTCFVG